MPNLQGRILSATQTCMPGAVQELKNLIDMVDEYVLQLHKMYLQNILTYEPEGKPTLTQCGFKFFLVPNVLSSMVDIR